MEVVKTNSNEKLLKGIVIMRHKQFDGQQRFLEHVF